MTGTVEKVASEKPSSLQRLNPDAFFLLDHETPQQLVSRIKQFSERRPLDAVVPADVNAIRTPRSALQLRPSSGVSPERSFVTGEQPAKILHQRSANETRRTGDLDGDRSEDDRNVFDDLADDVFSAW